MCNKNERKKNKQKLLLTNKFVLYWYLFEIHITYFQILYQTLVLMFPKSIYRTCNIVLFLKLMLYD